MKNLGNGGMKPPTLLITIFGGFGMKGKKERLGGLESEEKGLGFCNGKKKRGEYF